MFERIVVPLDGTEEAERALPVAARIAHATDGTLIVMSVVLPLVEFETSEVSRTVKPHPTERQTRHERAPGYLDEVQQRYAPGLEGVKTEQVVAAGASSLTIFEEACLHAGDLVVLCSQGESGVPSPRPRRPGSQRAGRLPIVLAARASSARPGSIGRFTAG